MFLRWLALDLVVHQGSYIVLQTCSQLIDSGSVGTTLHVILKQNIGFEDLLIGISEVILTSVCT